MASNSSNIIPQETVKFPPKLMVWGIMSFRAISKLHFIAPKQSDESVTVHSVLSNVTFQD